LNERKPEWLRIKVRGGQNNAYVENMLERFNLNTVCEEANCPNRMECFGRNTATFMILGNNCTRNCTFCNVTKKKPEPVNQDEPLNISRAVRELGLAHVVITSVTRDDLPDGGAGHFYNVIRSIKENNLDVTVEVLIPDFKGSLESLRTVIEAKPDIINHNVETVPRLYPEVRPMAVYERSLELLERVKKIDEGIYTKSGIMVGLGEKKEEVLAVFDDLRKAGCDFLTIGQYLAPSKKHHPVVEYIHLDVFREYKEIALEKGFLNVASAPLVRSSYDAAKMLRKSEQ